MPGLVDADLIAGNALFVDGTKIRANASRSKSHDQAYYESLMSEIEGRIEQLLEECEGIDRQEEAEGSWVAMDRELSEASHLKDKIQKSS